MWHESFKLLFRTLLIVSLMLQPMLMKSAMAVMPHQHQPMAMAQADMQTQHGMHQMHTMNKEGDSKAGMQDCCDHSCCSPAITIPVSVQAQTIKHSFDSSHEPLWFSISLPQEPHPPRV